MVKSSTSWQPSAAVRRAGSSTIRDLLELTERPEIISLAGGLPNPALFPADALAHAGAEAIADGPAALQYGATEGYRPLREWVAGRDGAEVDEVLVTAGSQQALDLIGRALLEPGQPAALAEPAYPGALQAFRSAGADLVGIPSDERGLRVDLLADRLAAGLRPGLVYVVPNFDNPTGSTLPADRRRALVDLADRYGFWLVEDDPYGELRWGGQAEPSLRSLDARTIRLGTTSKVLAPGLRVGWVVAPIEVRRALTSLKQSTDLHTGSLNQQIVHRTLTEAGFLDAHLARLRTSYRGQAEALADALRAELGDRISFEAPDGGMFLWARLGGVDTGALLDVALDHHVAFVPGAAFAVQPGAHADALRLSYATSTTDQLHEAAHRLAAAVDQTTERVTSMLPRVALE